MDTMTPQGLSALFIAATLPLALASCGGEAEEPPETRLVVFESVVNVDSFNLAPDCTPDSASSLFVATALDITRGGETSTLVVMDGLSMRDGESAQAPIIADPFQPPELANTFEVEVGSEVCLASVSTSFDGDPGLIEEGRACFIVQETTSALLFSVPITKGACTLRVSAFARVEGALPAGNSPFIAESADISDFYHGVVFDSEGFFTLNNIRPDCEEVETEAEIETRIFASTQGVGFSGDNLLLTGLDDVPFNEGDTIESGMPFEWLEGVEGANLCLSSSGTEEDDPIDDDDLSEDEQCVTLSIAQPRMEFELTMSRGACTLTFKVSATWYGEREGLEVEVPEEMICGDSFCVGEEEQTCPQDCVTTGVCDASGSQNLCITFSGEAWSDAIAAEFCSTVEGGSYVTGGCPEAATGLCVVQEFLRDGDGNLVPDSFAQISYYGADEENRAHCGSVGGFYPD